MAASRARYAYPMERRRRRRPPGRIVSGPAPVDEKVLRAAPAQRMQRQRERNVEGQAERRLRVGRAKQALGRGAVRGLEGRYA